MNIRRPQKIKAAVTSTDKTLAAKLEKKLKAQAKEGDKKIRGK